MKPKYRRLCDWAARGYLLIPTPWGRDLTRVRWRERSCVEAVILSRLLHRGIRGDELAGVVRCVRKAPAATLTAMASGPDGVDELVGAAVVATAGN